MQYSRHEAKRHAQAVTRGLWAAVTTPFTSTGEVDEEGMRRNVRYLVDEIKIDGLFCTGVMGEFWSLTTDERFTTMAMVVDEANGKVPVNVHTGHHSAREALRLTKNAEDVGADFVSMTTPYYPPRAEAGVFEFFSWICERVDIGVWLFDGPFLGPDAYAMSPETASRLADLENVCGIKIAWSLEHYDNFHRRLGDRILVCHANERYALRLMKEYGQQAHMSSAAPYKYQRPGHLPMRNYLALAENGDYVAAESLSASLDSVRRLDEKWIGSRLRNEGVLPIAHLKIWSSALGMAAGPVRPPLAAVAEEDEWALYDDLRAVGMVP